ncbi:hypothetical protein [Nonomuraea sp. NPDC001023]|uniref:hypothetical protein n=1 Tax=unclassified Nonomuraea TaxID=2593643 RepID=UPI0033301756
MTIDVRTLLPVAEAAASIAGEIITTRAPGVVTAKGDRDMATEVDFAVEHAVRRASSSPARPGPWWSTSTAAPTT